MYNNQTFKKTSLAIVVALALSSNASIAAEDTEQEKARRNGPDEILVITQHREQNIQDIPITMTAMGEEYLKKSDIFDAATIAQHVPGVAYSEFAPGQAMISIRGIMSADDGAGLENSTAVFLDGVYIGRGASINFDMFDLERIEVIRGPQGTLFGRNAIGGAFNVVTSKPTDHFTAKVGLTAGNEGILRYQGFVSGPLGDSDEWSGKLTFNHREHDGFVDNVLLGTELQDEDQSSFRAQLRYASGSSEWILSTDYMEDDRADMGRVGIIDKAPLTAIMAANGVTGPRQNASPYDGFSLREASGISLTGTIEYDQGVFTTISAYRTAETDWEMQSVGAGIGALGAPFDEVIDKIIEDVSTLSQEFRWTSNLDGNFNYSAGVYLFTEEVNHEEQWQTTKAGTYDGFTMTDVGSQDLFSNEYNLSINDTTSYAVYAEANWQFKEDWNLIIGGRYTMDDKDYHVTAVTCGAVPDSGPLANFAHCEGMASSPLAIIAESFQISPSDSWSNFSYKLALQYLPTDDLMFFGSVTTGYKAGGFAGSQGVESSASNPVDEETATNYEFGFKGDFADNTFRLNATAFYTDYQDLQIVRFGPVPGSDFGTFQTTNIGNADISGVELEWGWYPTDNFRLTGNYSSLDTEVNDLILNTTGGLIDASGKVLRQAPESSYNLIAGYNFVTDAGEFDLMVEYSYQDEQSSDYIDDRIIMDEYNLIDMRLAWTSESEKWEVALWGKNLSGEDYISHMYVIGPGGIGVYGPPKTVGVSVNYNIL